MGFSLTHRFKAQCLDSELSFRQVSVEEKQNANSKKRDSHSSRHEFDLSGAAAKQQNVCSRNEAAQTYLHSGYCEGRGPADGANV
jgi:hypothetical protein